MNEQKPQLVDIKLNRLRGQNSWSFSPPPHPPSFSLSSLPSLSPFRVYTTFVRAQIHFASTVIARARSGAAIAQEGLGYE